MEKYKQSEEYTKFRIKGHKISGALGSRLEETAVTAINDLPGVLVHTRNGVYYSELYFSGQTESIHRTTFNELTHGFVDYFTKLMADKGKSSFSIERIPKDIK